MKEITERQTEVLKVIAELIEQYEGPITYTEIAEKMGFKSITGAVDHFKALEKKGYAKKISGRHTSIQLTEKGKELI